MSFFFPLIAVLGWGNKAPSYLLTPPLLPVLETIDHSVAILWTLHSQTAEQKEGIGRKEGGCACVGAWEGAGEVGFGTLGWWGKAEDFPGARMRGVTPGERGTETGMLAGGGGTGTCQVCPCSGGRVAARGEPEFAAEPERPCLRLHQTVKHSSEVQRFRGQRFKQ